MSRLKHTKLIFFIKTLRISTFLLSTLCLWFYVREIFVKWKYDPVILKFERTIHSHMVPMPAITVCSPLISSDYAAEEFRPLFWHVCDLDMSKILFKWYYLNISFENPVNLLDEYSPRHDDVLDLCYYQGKAKLVQYFVRRILTDYGFCFTANLLDIEEIFDVNEISDEFWSYKRGSKEEFELENYKLQG